MSSKPRGDELLTPVDHAADLHRLIEALDVGAVDLFASSGGAIAALALVAEHPEQVRTLVAHEPPIAARRSPTRRPGSCSRPARSPATR